MILFNNTERRKFTGANKSYKSPLDGFICLTKKSETFSTSNFFNVFYKPVIAKLDTVIFTIQRIQFQLL